MVAASYFLFFLVLCLVLVLVLFFIVFVLLQCISDSKIFTVVFLGFNFF